MIKTKEFIKNLRKLFWKHELFFVEKRHEAADVYTFIFKSKNDVTWIPGQYISYRLGFGLTKHFTIASSPHEKVINITTRIFEKPSKFKKKLLTLKKGDRILAKDPIGDLVISDPGKEHIFIAGGIGITPFRSILWNLDHHKSSLKATLLYVSNNDQIPFKQEIDEISKCNESLKVKYIINRRIVNDDILSVIKGDLGNVIFLVSGPPSMVNAYQDLLRNLGVMEKNIKIDSFYGY